MAKVKKSKDKGFGQINKQLPKKPKNGKNSKHSKIVPENIQADFQEIGVNEQFNGKPSEKGARISFIESDEVDQIMIASAYIKDMPKEWWHELKTNPNLYPVWLLYKTHQIKMIIDYYYDDGDNYAFRTCLLDNQAFNYYFPSKIERDYCDALINEFLGI